MKKQKSSLLDNKKVTFVVALLIAVLVWVIIAGFVDPKTEKTISNVNVRYSRNENLYQRYDLMIVSDKVEKVNVILSGTGTSADLGGLEADAVVVYPDYSAVTEPGEYTVPLVADKSVRGYDVEVSPRSVVLTFAQVEKRMFTVKPLAEQVEAEEGYIKAQIAATPDAVTVSGPQEELDKVVSVEAVIHDMEVRRESKIYQGVRLRLMDADGNEIESKLLTVTPEEIEVKVPILEKREIDVTVGFSGVPAGFDTEWLNGKVSTSIDKIAVSGEKEVLDKNMSYEAGVVDLSQLDVGTSGNNVVIPFTVALPAGVQNADKVAQILVTFDTSGVVQKTFSVPTQNIRVANAPAGLEITPENKTYNVTLTGDEEQINKLLGENIVLEIDAAGTTAAQGGQQMISARVVVAKADRVFAVGDNTVVCAVEVG